MGYTPLFPEFWSDPDVVELESDHKLVLLYLFSNTNVTLSGIYPMSPTVASRESGVDKPRVETFFKKYRNVHYDDENRMIFVAKLLKRNKSGNPNWKKKGIISEYTKTKDSPLWKIFLKVYPDYDWLFAGSEPKKPSPPPVKPEKKKTKPVPPVKKHPEPPPIESRRAAPAAETPPSTEKRPERPPGLTGEAVSAEAPDKETIQSAWVLISTAYNKITGLKTGMVDVIKIANITSAPPSIIAYALARLHYRMSAGGYKKINNPIMYTSDIIKNRMVLPGETEGGDDMAFKEHFTAADWFNKVGIHVKDPNQMPSLNDIIRKL